MFEKIVLHGGAASLVWGYRPAAVLRGWRIARHEGQWTLSGAIERADRFQCQNAIAHHELRFTAARVGGVWCWPVVSVEIAGNQIQARLGPPEQ